MQYSDLLKKIKKSQFDVCYFLTGEESFFIDKIIEVLEFNTLPEDLKDFNLSVVFGSETNGRRVAELCREYPFMSDRRVVIVKEAQLMPEIEQLDAYFKNPAPTTILAIAFKNKKPDGRSAWVKTAKQKTIYFESEPLKDYQLPQFIEQVCQDHKLTVKPEAVQMLCEYLGNDLPRIDNEITKLALNLMQGEKLTQEHVADQIGVSKEFNVFELTKAISAKNTKNMYHIAKYMAAGMKNNPFVMVISSLYTHFTRMWIAASYPSQQDESLAQMMGIRFVSFIKEYRQAASLYSLPAIQKAFALLSEYDLRSKGVNNQSTSEEDLFLELVLKIAKL